MQSKVSGTHTTTKASEESASACPYDSYKGTKVWSVVEEAIRDLVKNRDIAEATRRDYIVGYICMKLELQ